MDFSAVEFALNTIGELNQQVTSLLGVDDQIESLERELRWMKSFLEVADSRKLDNDAVRTGVAEIRELAYDVEDVIETFALKVASQRKSGFSNCIERSVCFLKEGCLLHRTRSEIDKITVRIQELTRQLNTYDVTKLGDHGEGPSSLTKRRESRRPYPHVMDDNVVGMDGNIKELVSVLVEEGENRVVAKMKELGEGMVKHCAGLPLAIVVLGGILVTKNDSLHEWLKQGGDDGEIAEDVVEGYLMELVERYMIQVRGRDIATLKVKTLQMHDLMRDLCLSKAKQENFIFVVDQSNASSLSSIQRARRVSAHKFFRINCINSPMIRSLIIFDGYTIWDDALLQKVDDYFYRHFNDCTGNSVSVFAILGIIPVKLQRIWTYVLNNFKLLRILDFEQDFDDTGGCKLPNEIGNLIHLRFLSLNGIEFLRSKLPSSLGNLRRLQTLDLRVTCETCTDGAVHVPNVIWRMEQLRHLYLPDECSRKTKLKLGTLRNLQTLVNFNTDNCFLQDLINMTNIRELVIRGPFQIKDFNAEDSNKNPPVIQGRYLHSLSIINDKGRIDPRHLNHLLSSCVSVCKLSLAVEISEIPEYVYSFSNLDHLNLRMCKLEEDPMPTLEKLASLRALELNSLAFKGKEMCCSTQGFPKLEYLRLVGLQNLEEWKVDDRAMPCLRRLKIEYCPELKTVPDGLRYITMLQELEIKSMPKMFIDKLVEGGEDFNKVRHVPSRIFKEFDEYELALLAHDSLIFY
ncbi:hypothetical protein V6N11_061935 [Hibiscus sabdariffa]|uniref:Uncharacterized protein n=1 Tax=Hibiscus sabdariffa TaxID=183260 RepID=A0ABR2N7K9_9ROSI